WINGKPATAGRQPETGASQFHQLLEAPDILIVRHRRALVLHRRPADLPDIDVAAGVDRDAMGCGELADLCPGRIAQPGDRLALMRDDADAGTDAGVAGVDAHTGAGFADIGNRVAALGHAQAAGAVQVVPLGGELALAVEHLHAVVLPVGDIDPA